METSNGKNKDCIAWFRLAQLVTRQEKERSLAFFRLLSYSFKNEAYALQLEGDILLAFDDKEALMKYKQAAFLYKREKKVSTAVALYEHLLLHEPDNIFYLTSLLECYALLSWEEKIQEHFEEVLKKFKNKVLNEEQLVGMLEATRSSLQSSKAVDAFKAFLESHKDGYVASLATYL